MKPLLTIAIPYTVERLSEYNTLATEIGRQIEKYAIPGEVELISDDTGKHQTIGEKRNNLYQRAKGKYVWQIDSDDEISDNAIDSILAVIDREEPDCITFEEYINMDGKELKSNFSLQYHDWEGEGHVEFADGFHFHRTPFFKTVIKTEIAKKVPVPRLRWAEDHEWSRLLKTHLKTEHHINEQIYRYIHKSSNPTERYGLDQ